MSKQPTHYTDMADPQAQPRHTGIASFFRTPIADGFQDVDIGLIGVPFDGGVTHRSGARHGPRAVREQSALLRRINAATGVAPFASARVRDLGDCWIERPYELRGALDEIFAFYSDVVAARIVPLSVGGDHSISWPILRAVAASGPIGMVHIDAHCDTGDDYMGSRFHHGAPFRRAVDDGLLDPKRVIQIGIRGTTNDPDMWGFSHSSGMRVLGMDEFHDQGWRFAAAEARRIVGDGPVYLSFDIDSLDPSVATRFARPEFCRRRSGRRRAALRRRHPDVGQRGLPAVRDPLPAGGGAVEQIGWWCQAGVKPTTRRKVPWQTISDMFT